MRLVTPIESTKKVKTWLLVVLSLIPFVCIYSTIKLKKFRKMMLLNVIAGVGLFGILAGLVIVGHQPTVIPIMNICNYLILPALNGVFVYKWCKEHNDMVDLKLLI